MDHVFHTIRNFFGSSPPNPSIPPLTIELPAQNPNDQVQPSYRKSPYEASSDREDLKRSLHETRPVLFSRETRGPFTNREISPNDTLRLSKTDLEFSKQKLPDVYARPQRRRISQVNGTITDPPFRSSRTAQSGSSNDRRSPDMLPFELAKRRKKHFGQFRPVDTISNLNRISPRAKTTEPPNRRESPVSLWSRKSLSRQTEPLSDGRVVHEPPSKRQKIDRNNISEAMTPSEDKSQDDSSYLVSVDVEHVSSRPTKRKSLSSSPTFSPGTVDSYISVDSMMRSPRSSDRSSQRQYRKLAQNQDQKQEELSEDFEMAGMHNADKKEESQIDEQQYSNRAVALEKAAGREILGSSSSDDEVLEVADPAVKQVHLRPRSSSSRQQPPPPRPKQSLGQGEISQVNGTERISNSLSTKKVSSELSLQPPQKLNDVFVRDTGLGAEGELEMDNTDELQESPAGKRNKIPLSAVRVSENALAARKSRKVEAKHGEAKQDDDFKELTRAPSAAAGGKSKRKSFLVTREKTSKVGTIKVDAKPLKAFCKNSQELDGPLSVRLDMPDFCVSQADRKETRIHIEDIKLARFSNSAWGKSVQLTGSKLEKRVLTHFLVFDEPDDLRWFRLKLQFLAPPPSCKFDSKPEEWFEKAYQIEVSNADEHTKRQMMNAMQSYGNGGDTDPSDSLRRSARRETRSKINRERSPSTRTRRPRPYTEAMESGKLSWNGTLYYHPDDRQVVAAVDPQELDNLKPGEFLNDSLIWFGLRYMLENSQWKGRVHCFNSYFYNTLTRNGRRDIDYTGVKRWTSKQGVDIFQKDYVIVPINHSLHWFVAIICNLTNMERSDGNEEETRPPHKPTRPKRLSAAPRDGPVITLGPSNGQDVTKPNVEEIQQHMEQQYSQLSLASAAPSPIVDGADDNNLPKALDGSASNDNRVGIRDSATESSQRASTITSSKDDDRGDKDIQPKVPFIITLDSLGDARPDVVRNLKQYLRAEALDKKGFEFDTPSSKAGKGIPLQPNSCDCGLFLIEYVKQFLRDPDTFVEKITTRKMELSDWPDTVAEDLRDDFRELLLQEVARQFDFEPANDAMTLSVDARSPNIASNGAVDRKDLEAPADGKSESHLDFEKQRVTEIKHKHRSNLEQNAFTDFEVRVDKLQDHSKRSSRSSKAQGMPEQNPLKSKSPAQILSQPVPVRIDDDHGNDERPRTRGKRA